MDSADQINAFQALGVGVIAYMKVLDYHDVIALAGPTADIKPDEYAVALIDADGSPIAIRGTVAAAIVAAEDFDCSRSRSLTPICSATSRSRWHQTRRRRPQLHSSLAGTTPSPQIGIAGEGVVIRVGECRIVYVAAWTKRLLRLLGYRGRHRKKQCDCQRECLHNGLPSQVGGAVLAPRRADLGERHAGDEPPRLATGSRRPDSTIAPKAISGTMLSPNGCRTVTAGTQMPERVERYRRSAEQCLEAAKAFKDPEAKRTMLVTAGQWLMLAAQRVKQTATLNREDATP
jgi:hypothetical protein